MDLLDVNRMDSARLVDIICIDLMQRHRLGHEVMVEDYVADFPILSVPMHLLDVIDAEICVTLELNQTITIESYESRFPEIFPRIREMLDLNQQSREPAVGNDNADEFSFDHGLTRSEQCDCPDFQTPSWFVGHRYAAGGIGGEGKAQHWLIRGRDRLSGTRLALKVVELPALWNSSNSHAILDACEQASTVSHPSWVRPLVATVQDRYLSVIRPWIFARPYRCPTGADDLDIRRKLFPELATVAYALAAAHRVGATHGAVHVENLLVDQQGQMKIVDAASGRQTLARWFECGQSRSHQDGADLMSFEGRRQADVDDLVKLIATTSIGHESNERSGFREIVSSVTQAAFHDPEQPCAAIGDTLMQLADGLQPSTAKYPVQRRRTWHRVATQWWSGKNET